MLNIPSEVLEIIKKIIPEIDKNTSKEEQVSIQLPLYEQEEIIKPEEKKSTIIEIQL